MIDYIHAGVLIAGGLALLVLSVLSYHEVSDTVFLLFAISGLVNLLSGLIVLSRAIDR